MIYAAVAIYAFAMVVANLLISEFGRAVVPLNAFLLIGLDLALRDLLHVRLKPSQMGALIAVSGALTYALNPSAAHIALASACAFAAASLSDWAVFSSLRGTWMVRANASNVAGALVDSIVFPAMAFGGLDPALVAQMFAAKVAGGFAWSLIIQRSRLVGRSA